MKSFRPQARITLGMVGVVASLVLLAFFLNVIPDSQREILRGRAVLAEAIAVYSTALVKTSSVSLAGSQRLRDDFTVLIERNEDLLSLALRHEGGRLLVSAGDHEAHWKTMAGEYSLDSQVKVPIWAGDQKWGQLELRFVPLAGEGFWSVWKNPTLRTVLFIAGTCMVVFFFYLGKVLRLLDPSRAVPGRVRSALDTMAEGLLILDRKEQIVLANQAFAGLVRRSPDDLLGFRAGDLPWQGQDGQEIGKSDRPWIAALTEGKVKKDRIIRLTLDNGLIRTLKTNCSPVLGEGGRYAGVLVSFDDITELEKKEVELRKSKQEAEEANRAKSTFLANMSHEIRSPMNAILGFTELLKRGYVKNEAESLRYLSIIHSSGKSLLELINDILDLSKVEAGHLDVERLTVEPYSILHEVVQMLRVRAEEKGITLEIRAVGELPETVQTDPVRLRQIAFNLIGNSVKFTETGGVTVTCSLVRKGQGGQFVVTIADTGIGISAEAQTKIFDPFVQADSSVTRRFGGTGLGLPISRKFARILGGDITLQSAPGQGSTFTVALDAGDLAGVGFVKAEQMPLLMRRVEQEANAAWRFDGGRVLVVDDGAENREMIRLLLEEAGVVVEEAENGQVCIAKVESGDYDVIIMDVQMPVMDGFAATGILRRKGVTVPIVALTANAMIGFEAECQAAGYSDYLSKPISIDRFMELMAQLLGGQRVSSEVGRRAMPAPGVPLAYGFRGDTAPIFSTLPAGNPKFLDIIRRFAGRLEEQLDNMDKALAAGDARRLADLAHWLKGAGGTVGFRVFTEPARELEIRAKEGQLSGCAGLIGELRALSARLAVPGQGGENSLSSAEPEGGGQSATTIPGSPAGN